MIKLVRPLKRWQFTTLPHTGTCRIDGQALRLRLRLTAKEPPVWTVLDVLEVEKWVNEFVLAGPTTAEEFALAAAEQFPGHSVFVVGFTDTHGEIEVEA